MNKKILFNASLIFAAVIGFPSCMSTETVEPEEISESDAVVLSLKAPETAKTRADQGYMLRYSARIFYGASSSVWDEPIQTQEIIDGDNNNLIVFKVDPNANYTIMVFADYIPSTYVKGTDGTYPDYFYNTKSNSKQITLRTTPGKDSETVSADFFNNDNYDCFFERVSFQKTELEKNISMTLQRATAKVTLCEKTSSTGDCSISVNKLGVRKMFNFVNKTSSDPYDADKNLGSISLPGQVSVDVNNKDLFYFYTTADSITSPQNVSIDFTVQTSEGTSNKISVTDIPVKRNYKTVVSGECIPSNSQNDPEEEIPSSKLGDINLTLSTNTSWEQTPLEK